MNHEDSVAESDGALALAHCDKLPWVGHSGRGTHQRVGDKVSFQQLQVENAKGALHQEALPPRAGQHDRTLRH